ncbi:MAG: hypothetical protein IJT02_07110 [Synergistaceae bacterium]|nr:hypothetical protein [Synergistaceae bacterium]
MNNRQRIDQLLSMAWNSQSTARTLAIVNQILEISPGNVDALIMKADITENLTAKTKLLARALEALNDPENYEAEDREVLLYVVNQRLAFALFYDGKFAEAFTFCKEAVKYGEAIDDPEADETKAAVKSMYYRLLVMRGDWSRILEEAMKDEEHSLAWGYSRLIAAWMLAPGNARSICAGMFWDVLMLGADVPFYMLGYFPEPGDEASDEAHDEFDFALLFYDSLSVSEDFYQWFTRGTILFGLLSGRFEEKEREYLLDVLDTLGGYEEYEKMSSLIVEGDDEAVIEMLAANKCLAE